METASAEPEVRHTGDAGFTLIEMIGVLAIIAVLAAALFPVMIRRIDKAVKKQEVANLLVLSNALTRYTVRSGAVPTVSGWTNAIESWSSFPAAKAVANSRRFIRYYFTQASASPAANGVTSRPTSARAMIVSTLGGQAVNADALPDPRGGALQDSEFDVLWNTRDGSLPGSGTFAGGRVGDDLLIQRIDYAPLFHRLVLVNRDTRNASYQIEDGAVNYFPSGSPNPSWQAYYITGSLLTLGDAAGAPMTKQLLRHDVGFVFEGGFWRDQIMGSMSTSTQPDDFAAKAQVFLEAPWNTNARQGANTSDQQTVLTAMYSFMYTYTLWANQRPHFPWHGVGGTSGQQVPEFELLQDVADPGKFLDVLTQYLVR